MSLPIHAFHPSSHTLDGDISNIYKTFLRDLDLHQEQVQAQKIQSVTVCEVRVILIRMYAEVNTISSFVAFYLVQSSSFFNNSTFSASWSGVASIVSIIITYVLHMI